MKTIQLSLLALLCSFATNAQVKTSITRNSRADLVVTRVVRTVFMADTTDYFSTKLRPETSDTALAELLTNMILAGKLTAYDTGDMKLSITLAAKDIKGLVMLKPETIRTYNEKNMPVDKVVENSINYEAIKYYHVIEEWKYNIKHGTTDIQILAIAPMKEVYNTRGEFYGRYPLYYVKYAAVKEVLDRYELQHPNCNFPRAVWNNFFAEQSPAKPKNHD